MQKKKPPEGSSDSSGPYEVRDLAEATLPDPPPLGSFDGIALYEPLAHIINR